MTLLTIDEPNEAPATSAWHAKHPLWRLGFRPFYLLAAVFSALAIPLWTARLGGAVDALQRVSVDWHMHEMVFGMAIAVIIGFLYTAGRTWTGLWTPREGPLAALAGLWLAGRAAMLLAPPGWAALVDLLFLPCAAWPMYSVLRRSGNTRNLFLVVLLAVLALCNLLFHLALLGIVQLPTVRPIQAAILVIVMIEAVIGGRVLPMFTRNGAPGSNPVVRPALDKAALAAQAGASLSWIFGLPGLLTAVLCFAAAAASLCRLAGWQPQRTVRLPLLWILHLSYSWIGVGFALLGLAAVGIVAPSAAIHALTVGSMAGLIIGMMTRTSLGHTGRPLKAAPSDTIMYSLIQAGAVARLAAAFVPAPWRMPMLVAATLCWALSFGLFAVIYSRYLWQVRLDGREG